MIVITIDAIVIVTATVTAVVRKILARTNAPVIVQRALRDLRGLPDLKDPKALRAPQVQQALPELPAQQALPVQQPPTKMPCAMKLMPKR